jgi:hypothetical protein
MRVFATTTICAALLSGAAFAQSTWTEFNNPEQGFVVSFPAAPAIGHMAVKAQDGSDADETLYAVSTKDALYSFSVIDFKNAVVDGNAEIERAINDLRREGNITLDLPARVNFNRGRQLSVTGGDGSHSTVGIFFADQKLYEIKGTMLASSDDPVSGDLIRFQQSLSFTGNRGFGGGFRGRGFGPPPGFQGRGFGRRFRQQQDAPPQPIIPPPQEN